MPRLRFFTIICLGLLLVLVYGCDKSVNDTEAAEANAQGQEQVEQASEGEQGEHAVESERGEHAEEDERGEHASEGERGEHAGERERDEHAGEGERGEHAEEGGESGEGEETGPRLAKDGTHDEVRKGVRLILSFDEASSSFIGTVENVTEKTVSKVRIEVHLSNGTELGPTNPIDLAPGKKVDVGLSAEGQSFEWWKAHAEAGASEL